MDIEPFTLERYFARHEFSARYLLSSSDCEPLRLAELLGMADGEARAMWDGLRLAYTESAGHPLLREAIAARYDRVGADEVLVAAPEEGIFLLMHALLSPGDHVVCVAPAYQSFHEVARSIGCEVSAWLPDEARGWHYGVEALAALLRGNTRLVVVNFPHNPTGFAPSREELRGAGRGGRSARRPPALGRDVPLPRALAGHDPSGGVRAVRARDLALRRCRRASVCPGCASAGWRRTTAACSSGWPPSRTTPPSAPPRRARSSRSSRCATSSRSSAGRWSGRGATSRSSTGSSPATAALRLAAAGGRFGVLPRYLGPEGTSALADEVVERAGIMVVPSGVFGFGDRHLRIGFGREDLPEVVERFGDYLDRR